MGNRSKQQSNIGEPGSAEYITNCRIIDYTRGSSSPTRLNELLKIFNVPAEWAFKRRMSYLRGVIKDLENKKDITIAHSMKISDPALIMLNNNEVEEYDKEIDRNQKAINFIKKQLAIIEDKTIPEEEKQEAMQSKISIDNIKKHVKIKTLLQSAGIKIERNNFFKLRNEKTPSAQFHEDKNLYFDHGSQEGGSVIDLYMKLNDCELSQAIKELTKLI